MLVCHTVGSKSRTGGAKSGPGGSKSTPGETNPGGRPAGRAGPRLVQEAGSLYEASLAGLGWHGSQHFVRSRFPARCEIWPPRTL